MATPKEALLRTTTYSNVSFDRSFISNPLNNDDQSIPLSGTDRAVSFLTPLGNQVTYSLIKLNYETVKLSTSNAVVTIDYPDQQSISTVMQNADSLVLAN